MGDLIRLPAPVAATVPASGTVTHAAIEQIQRQVRDAEAYLLEVSRFVRSLPATYQLPADASLWLDPLADGAEALSRSLRLTHDELDWLRDGLGLTPDGEA